MDACFYYKQFNVGHNYYSCPKKCADYKKRNKTKYEVKDNKKYQGGKFNDNYQSKYSSRRDNKYQSIKRWNAKNAKGSYKYKKKSRYVILYDSDESDDNVSSRGNEDETDEVLDEEAKSSSFTGANSYYT
jgi:hypothetical protein